MTKEDADTVWYENVRDKLEIKNNYEYSVLMCANRRLQVHLRNVDTDQEIPLDDTYEDVKKLYDVLKEYFENGEKDFCYPKSLWSIDD